MDKKAFILGMINAGGLGLEIGPSFNPLVPKRDGFRVKTLDYAPREVLVANYRAEGMPQHQLNAVEVVDYVWTGEPLPKLVGDTRFDYIVASHVSSTRPISSGS